MSRAAAASSVIRAVSRLAVVAVLGALAAPAQADPAKMVVAPAGWHADAEQAASLVQRLNATVHFGGLASAGAAEAYVSDKPGVALFATRLTASLPAPAAADPALRAALDELRASTARARLTGGTAVERAWHEQLESEAKQADAALTWSDPASYTSDSARIVVASDGSRIVAVTGECLVADDVAPALTEACQAALATLATGIPAPSRVALTLAAAQPTSSPAAPQPAAAAPAAAAPAALATAPVAASSGAPAVREPARLNDASRFVLPPTVIPMDRPPLDQRPIYAGAAVIVFAVAIWWSKRRRDQFGDEAEHETRNEREARPRRPARRRDPDADDLHAAARGDAATADEPRDERHDQGADP